MWSNRILPLEIGAVASVATRMRAADAREIYACRWTADPITIAHAVVEQSRFGFVAWTAGNTPAAVVACAEHWPGFYQVAMFATDDWPDVAAITSRAARRWIKPAMLDAGGRRAEARSHASHSEAHRWLTWLGFVAESRMPEFGRNGEEFILFVWRRNHVHVRQFVPAATPAAAAGAVA